MTAVINVYSKSNNVLGTTRAAEAPARAAPVRRVRTNGAEARTSVKTEAPTRSPPRPWGRVQILFSALLPSASLILSPDLNARG